MRQKNSLKMFSRMPLQFTPFVFGVALAVALGTVVYHVWNSTNQNQNRYNYNDDTTTTFDCGYDTPVWKNDTDEKNERLKRRKKTVEKCSICLDDMKMWMKNVSLLKCNHSFHTHCIERWFMMSNGGRRICPICRDN
ncbi:unnamed protein product [Phyllotreta striolata]|uniref:RING-type domain-containing protein n=1 Tax=Phyllotreta striolata TaxID=444603 RepID=A0A9N9TS55_PHYSR|nr:unnamed protein product [Phyllotreta striolata]